MKTQHAILLVEDDPDVQWMLEEVLRAGLAANVTVTSNITTALAALRSTDFDLIVTDLELPDGRGTEVAQAARSLPRRVPVVLHSGASRLAQIAATCGADACAAKSADPSQLLDACRSLMPSNS